MDKDIERVMGLSTRPKDYRRAQRLRKMGREKELAAMEGVPYKAAGVCVCGILDQHGPATMIRLVIFVLSHFCPKRSCFDHCGHHNVFGF